MNIPGFTAEAAIYSKSLNYRLVRTTLKAKTKRLLLNSGFVFWLLSW